MDVTSYLLGKKSGGGTPDLEDLNVTPSTSEQSFNHEGKDGYNNVTVEAVTSSIDSNIQAENIKKDVEILGVTGTLEGGGDISEYFAGAKTFSGSSSKNFLTFIIKKIPENNWVVENMASAFRYCEELEEVSYIETKDCISFNGAFRDCPKLLKVAKLDLSSANEITYMFSNSTKIQDLGGFENLGKAYSTSAPAHNTQYILTLSSATQLTEQSIINVLNNLYDIASSGVVQQDVVLGATNLAKLTSPEGQQALADAATKGWLVR